jgi:processive 1,2-diacylglycerol beta-glucosyltransferase
VIRGNNLRALAWKLDRLLADPARLAALRSNARRIAWPHAARDVVAALLGRGAHSHM